MYKTHPAQVFMSVFAFLVILSCGTPEEGRKSEGQDGLDPMSNAVEAAREAFEYGLPLILTDLSRRQMMNGSAEMPAAPVNGFRHRSSFPDASFKDVVRPNADTYYSIAWLDLQKEPVVLTVPDTKGRYYMLPMMDAYTNVFASPGSRTTGNSAGKFLVTGPSWKGEIPKDHQQIASPTDLVWIIGRTQVNSKVDGEKLVVPLQQKFDIRPLSQQGKKASPEFLAFDSTVPKGSPNDVVRTMPIEQYFNYLNALLAKYPPPQRDSSMLTRIAQIGIKAGASFDLSKFSAADQDSMKTIPGTTIEALKNYLAKPGKRINGWSEVDPDFGEYGTNYAERARVAYVGLGANLAVDALYPSCYVDSAGAQLNGAQKYTLRFEKGQTPPANAFWSITLYDPEGYMVVNPINRNAIGDRSNLKANKDGSIDIYIQKASPGKHLESNWLPAPKGDFNLLLRVYWPKDEILKGVYTIPAVKKVKS